MGWLCHGEQVPAIMSSLEKLVGSGFVMRSSQGAMYADQDGRYILMGYIEHLPRSTALMSCLSCTQTMHTVKILKF